MDARWWWCRMRATSVLGVVLAGACSAPQQPPRVPQSVPQAARPAEAPPEPLIPPLTLEGYKKQCARRVAVGSKDMFEEPLPEMLKSVVVLDVTIDRNGNLVRVSVRRSNGYKALENRALENVRHAAPFEAPAFTVRRPDGSVNFLETFLFRDDGRFQIRSLVAEK
jgi:periplasmic protein TonB